MVGRKVKGSMPPSRKNAAGKRGGSSQPSRGGGGIQLFFARNGPSSTSPVAPSPSPPPARKSAPEEPLLPETSESALNCSRGANDKACQMRKATDQPSPEDFDVKQSRSSKRQCFIPSMLIQQSQDDGGDEVVWRISPTTERLQGSSAPDALAQGQLPKKLEGRGKLDDVHKALNRNSSFAAGSNLVNAPPRRKSSPSLAGKLEQWLLTSKHKKCIEEKPGVTSKSHFCDQEKENDDSAHLDDSKKVSGTKLVQFQSTSKTPLSSSGEHVVNVLSQKKKGISKPKKTMHRRKALLELLDRVQNVISVQDSSINSTVGSEASEFSNGSASSFMDHSPFKLSACNKDLLNDTLTLEPVVKGKDASVIDGTNCKEQSSCVESPSNGEKSKNRDVAMSESKEHGDYFQKCYAIQDVTFNKLHSPAFKQDSTSKGNPTTGSSVHVSIHYLVLEVADVADDKDGIKLSLPMKVLRLLNEQSGDERMVHLCDEWFYTVIRPGDTVNVIGDFSSEGLCTIDQKNNFLIVHPDILISGSRVGASFSCPRRAVLDERIRSAEISLTPLVGTMIHQLFQAGLVRKPCGKEILELEAQLIVQKHIESLYAAGGNEKEALGKLKAAIPTILNWLDSFFLSPRTTSRSVDFGVKDGSRLVSISEVVDIEEMIWSPKYGLKGMIDASIETQVTQPNQVTNNYIMPLEFKTGKATTGQAAVEHRAQVILYSLLMSDRYTQDIGEGLLYYLHTNQTQGVTIKHGDLVGLLMRRNDHATNILAASQHILPPMLQTLRTCQGCWHLNTCSIYHKVQEAGTSESSGLGQLFDDLTGHLSESHVEFLKHWDSLIDLEAQDVERSHSEIWRMPSRQREESGRCLSSMSIDSVQTNTTTKQSKTGVSSYVYRFCRNEKIWIEVNREKGDDKCLSGSLQERSFSCGDYVLLSTEDGHTAVAGGVVIDLTHSSIMISLSRPLRGPGILESTQDKKIHSILWRIDKDDVASFLAIMRFNLLQLFVKTNGLDHFRELIVDLMPPRFDTGGIFSQDPAAMYVRSASGLNDDQCSAIHKVLSAKDYALILGMPGTGKTSTIVHAVKALLARGASILLTSYTNSAVDNILLKLKTQGIDFVRLGRIGAIHPDLLSNTIEGLGIVSVKDVESRMNEVNVVGATCLGITHPLLTNRKFDVCIVDEAGQITLPVCLGPLRFANKFVLVGDLYQLPPLVRNPEAREKGFAVSLFKRLSEAYPQAISALECQYRMCAGIMDLSNSLIYGNRLRCGSEEVANAQLELNGVSLDCYPSWLQKVLNPSLSVAFLNTDALPAHETNHRKTIFNMVEATILIEIIQALVAGGVAYQQIGVISPYNSQVELIRRLVAEEGWSSLEVHTIDKYQGRDKDCILVSFVRSSNQCKSTGTLLSDWHRINVAITRAKRKLIMIGSKNTLSRTPLLRLLIKQVEDHSGGLLHLEKKEMALAGSLLRTGTSSHH